MNTLVVVAHPRPESFCKTLVDVAVTALRSAGHEVRVIDLYCEGYQPVMHAEEWRAYRDFTLVPDDTTTRYVADVQWARQLVFVYPLWWSGLPAILKGWLERTMIPGVAFDFDAKGRIRGVADIRRIVGICTYGSPAWYIRFLGDAGRRTLTQAMRFSCRQPALVQRRWLALYAMDTATHATREAFLRRVQRELSGPIRGARLRERLWTLPAGRPVIDMGP